MLTHSRHLLAALALLLLYASAQRLSVDPLTSHLVDEKGRFIFYHGVNEVYKEFPYYPNTTHFNPQDSLSTEDFENLRSWGMRAMRLFVSWEGFEPVEGHYNYTYLEKIREITQTAKKFNIDIILDSHQDLYSKRFCGEGFPDWLFSRSAGKGDGYYSILNFPSPLKVDLRYDDQGNPLKIDCLKLKFDHYYLSEDVMRFSNQFFTNSNGMADKFIRMWMNVIGYFKSESNVIGYDLINEPSGANLWKNPYTLLGPGFNNNRFLLPFYKKLAAEIRKIDQEKLILFEPSVADYFGGFYSTPSPTEFKHLDVLSYHAYCPFQNDRSEPTSEFKCQAIDGLYIQQREHLVRKLKCGSMMTEFGSVPETQIGLNEIERVLSSVEKNWGNWFWWQFKFNADSTCTGTAWDQSFYYPNGTLQHKKVKLLSHPYAYAVCGSPISESYSMNSYTLKIRAKGCGGSFTEVFLNEELYFPNGFTVSFMPKCSKCLLESVGNIRSYYKLVVDGSVLHQDLEVRVAGFI